MHPIARKFAHAALGLAAVATGSLVAAAPASAADSTLPFKVGGYSAGGSRVAAGGYGAFDVLPSSVDLSGKLPAVGDQGQIGDCVAWTIAHSIMGYYANKSGGTGAPYAPLYLYMRVVASGGAPNSGLYPPQALTEAQTKGVDTQDDYSQGTTVWQTAPTAQEVANAAKYKITGYTTLWNGANQGSSAQTAIQQALAAGNPVAIGLPVYKDFMYLGANTLYNTLSGTSLGGHMITAYGYDADGIWVRNQWGTNWGTNGNAHLSWAFVKTNVNAAYAVNGLTTPASTVSVTPTVTALSVAKGSTVGGGEVTLTGSGFTTATAVKFGDTSATFRTTVTNGVTSLVATVPVHATPGAVDVTVTNPAGTSTSVTADKFTFSAPPPTVTKVDTTTVSTKGGNLVTLTGTNLIGATAVKLGTAAGSSLKVISATSLSFVAPAASAGAVHVTVTTASGTSTTSDADKVTYVVPPLPTVTSLSPASGSTVAATTVTVTGTEFGTVSKVTAAGTSVTYTKVSDTQLKVTLPAHAAGAVDLQITTANGTSGTVAADKFTYVVPPLPTVASISPVNGPTYTTSTVTVTGTNYDTVSKVTVGGVGVAFTKVSNTQLTLTMPTHAAGALDIQVTTAGGTSAAAAVDKFTYLAPAAPTVASVSPSTGSISASTTVEIGGTSFVAVSKVTVNGLSVPYTLLADGKLRVTMPPHMAGSVAVQVTTPGGTSIVSSTTQYVYSAKITTH